MTPYLPLGGQGALKFLSMTEIYWPHVLTKYWALEFKQGHGGHCQKNFGIFLGRPRGEADLGPLREQKFIFCTRYFGSDVRRQYEGLDLDICGDRREPASKVDRIFLKILVKCLKRSP